ncbi:2194_t:CDS:2 [Rhizophagus irregularis]|nr:2194_t:CDS:2 [Rhizophagus irregularis]
MEYDFLSFVRYLVLTQSDGPIPILQKNFYIIEKGNFESFFPKKSYQQANDAAELIKQLNESQVAGILVDEKYHCLINEEFYRYRKQVIQQQYEEKNQLESERQNLMKEVFKYQPALGDAKSFNPEKMQHDLQFRNQKLEREWQKLKGHNDNLKKEASEYQSALGDATSFHLGNQDSDTASKLSKDIGNLHHNLEKFCELKKGIEIINDQKEIDNFLKNYDCSIKGAIKENKNLISGALERCIIEIIIKKAEEYFNHEENDKDNKEVDEQGDKRQQQNLEAKIVKTTDLLLEMINSFSTIRTGNDKISKSTSTKLRQQIYGILGNRGFSNTVLDESDGKEHPLVEKLRKEILDLMNRYRKIKDQEKLAKHEKMINDIIRQVVNIFFFRLKVQEPTAEWKWFPKDTEINTLTMDGPWDKDEYLSVDICAFPLIGSNLNSAEDAKMMFPAQIVANDP